MMAQETGQLQADTLQADTLKHNPLAEVVITATRTDKTIEELPIPRARSAIHHDIDRR